MPEAWTHWECDNCRKPYSTFEEAEQCETQHIVDKVASGFSEKLDKIFPRPGKTSRGAKLP